MRENRASKTAIVVTRSQALIGASPESGLPMDPAAVAFANQALEIAGHHGFVRALRVKAIRQLLRAYESLMIPGLARHQVLRKQFIEARVRAALDSGIRQVIQVGAGLDSLCFRLHGDYPRASFLEWDHPATQSLKHRVLQSLGTGDNLRLRSLDLSSNERLPTTTSVPTMIIAEGVLMYLPRQAVTDWLRQWRDVFPDTSRVMFTHMDAPGFHRQSAAVKVWLTIAGEPFRWHAGCEEVTALLRETGWTPSEFHATWQNDEPTRTASGEWISEARSSKIRARHLSPV